VSHRHPAHGRRRDRPLQADLRNLPGWTDTSVGVTRYEDLPVNAQRYLDRIQETTGVPIHVVSTSPDRDHTILIRHPFGA
jgi:adenylosuccinate synthase